MRTMLAMGFLGAGTIALALLGCTSRLGPVRASQTEGGIDRPNLPDSMVARSRDCVAEYGSLLEPGHHEFNATVQMNEDGDKEDVTIDGIPNSAYDLGACMRNALRAMPIAKEPLRQGVETLKYQLEHASEEHHSIARFINVIPGVPIVVSELVFEAEGYTFVLPVAVKVVAKPEKWIDDKRIVAKLGQLAMANLGYDEIMSRAEQMGWVTTVLVEQAQSATEKVFIGDVPPTSSAVVEAAFKRVMTRAAPAALLASQADSPAPGPGDAVAVGILAVGLLAVGAIAAYEIIAVEGMPVATTPVPAPASAAQPKAAAPPLPAPRRYPNQTCENAELDRLQDEKKKICNLRGGYAVNCSGDLRDPKFDRIPCSTVKRSIQQRQACLAARWAVQDKCFGGKPDDRHKKPIDEQQQGLDNCEALKLKVCAKGHPMAEM